MLQRNSQRIMGASEQTILYLIRSYLEETTMNQANQRLVIISGHTRAIYKGPRTAVDPFRRLYYPLSTHQKKKKKENSLITVGRLI